LDRASEYGMKKQRKINWTADGRDKFYIQEWVLASLEMTSWKWWKEVNRG
jgi:hypothetical protein